MDEPKPAKTAFAGLNLADDLRDFEPDASSAPARPDAAALTALSERAGFPSREPRVAKPPPIPRPLNFDARLTIRVAGPDKQRFDDLVYRLRVSNGEAFRRLLDHFETTAGPAG
jgi:hypothetical protein